jgi:hypothetical protein
MGKILEIESCFDCNRNCEYSSGGKISSKCKLPDKKGKPKFEYLRMSNMGVEDKLPNGRMFFGSINDLNILGDQGWQLVTVLDTKLERIYIFIRELEQTCQNTKNHEEEES